MSVWARFSRVSSFLALMTHHIARAGRKPVGAQRTWLRGHSGQAGLSGIRLVEAHQQLLLRGVVLLQPFSECGG